MPLGLHWSHSAADHVEAVELDQVVRTSNVQILHIAFAVFQLTLGKDVAQVFADHQALPSELRRA